MATQYNFISSTSLNFYYELSYYEMQVVSQFNTSSPVQDSTISTSSMENGELVPNLDDIDLIESFQETYQIMIRMYALMAENLQNRNNYDIMLENLQNQNI